MASILIYLLVICIVIGVAYYLITNFLPEPAKKWGVAILIVIIAILLINFLLTGGVARLGIH